MMSTGRKSAGGNEEEEMALPIKSCRVVNRISYQASGTRNSWEQYGICVCACVCQREGSGAASASVMSLTKKQTTWCWCSHHAQMRQ